MSSASMAVRQPSAMADDMSSEAVQQCLTFFCAGEEYGIDILRVQEIKGWSGATPVPRTPEYVLGVMNLRGVIVPVIDLRRRFGLEAREFDASTVVVVVRVQAAHGAKTVGIAVDGVSEVCAFPPDAVTAPPRTGGRTEQAFTAGLATVDDRMVTILDIDALVASALEEF